MAAQNKRIIFALNVLSSYCLMKKNEKILLVRSQFSCGVFVSNVKQWHEKQQKVDIFIQVNC